MLNCSIYIYYLGVTESEPGLALLDSKLKRRQAEACLDHAERNRYQRFRSKKSADTFLLARYLLKTALAKKLRCQACDVDFYIEDGGKPLLKNSDALHFSLSHCNKAIVFAISDNNIGLDVEDRDRKGSPWRKPQTFFSEQVAKDIVNSDPDVQQQRFFRYWTAMEALVKWQGSGIFQLRQQFTTAEPLSHDGVFQFEEKSLITQSLKDALQLCVVGPSPLLPTFYEWRQQGFIKVDSLT
ncbi:4'-phosphopantetheinyl transferase superfamily protein [Agaribacterium sp. ZY112]|uniref:4'-phosphopantetheinyl transferase family protein n=1 Tax=Agaribacterium sp. ZY112 TaxID=3233574 RepID=UPI0035249414